MLDVSVENHVYRDSPSGTNTQRKFSAVIQNSAPKWKNYRVSRKRKRSLLVLGCFSIIFLIGISSIFHTSSMLYIGHHEPHVDYNMLDLKDNMVNPPQTHYTFNKTIMTPSFRGHLFYLSNKIARNWSMSTWKDYDKVDITNCDAPIPMTGGLKTPLLDSGKGDGGLVIGTPECAMWREILPSPAGGTGNKSKHAEEHVALETRDKDNAKASIEEYQQRPYRKCCVEHQQLRDTTWYVLDRLDANQIDYFFLTGSALGAIRHNGTIIPWDTDVDIGIFPDDARKIEEIFGKDSNLVDGAPHFFERDHQGKAMYWIHASKDGFPHNGPHVEIFYQKRYSKNLKELLPFENCNFYGRIVNCPNRKMLKKWFPTGWWKYSGGHYEGKGRCSYYFKGKKRRRSR
eukprot:Tbor_TRINITY_DN5580_c0_g1::TRINITY_DN5580_c0_g1_i8::g.13389::m.13389